MTVAFLVPGIFLPRLTLFICWVIGAIPSNDTPFALDVIGGIIAPRALIAWWAYQDPGTHPLWAVLFAALQVIEWLRAPQQVNTVARGGSRRGQPQT